MNQFSLTYELVGTGWARATLTLDGADTVVTASYISDALRDLIDATSVMTEGGPTARCAWQEEPGEYRWIFTVEQTGVRLEIRSFPDMFDTAEDARGEIVFTTTQPLRTLSRSILRAVDGWPASSRRRPTLNGGSSIHSRPKQRTDSETHTSGSRRKRCGPSRWVALIAQVA